MIQIDSSASLALSLDEVCSLDATRLSNPETFRNFVKGIHIEEDFLLNERWSQLSPRGPVDVFHFILHEMLPTVYDADWLRNLGGHIGFRLTGIGDYTLICLNRRTLTLRGLPTDSQSGAEVIDLEIAPDIFLAFCRGLLLNLAADILEDENEFEDRVVSHAELMLHGMPSGGYRTTEGRRDFVGRISDAQHGNVGTVNSHGVGSGRISGKSDRDLFAVFLEENRSYNVTLHSISLLNSNIRGVYSGEGVRISRGGQASGYNDVSFSFQSESQGVYYIDVGRSLYGRSMRGSGTYELSVEKETVSFGNWEPQNLRQDWGDNIHAANAGNVGTVRKSHGDDYELAEGSLINERDVDWIALDLKEGLDYAIEVEASERGIFIEGVYDSGGRQLYAGVVAGRRSVRQDWLNLTPQYDDTYYVAVASIHRKYAYGEFSNNYFSNNYKVKAQSTNDTTLRSRAEASDCATRGIGIDHISCNVNTGSCAAQNVDVYSIACGQKAYYCGGHSVNLVGGACGMDASSCGAAADHVIGTACGFNSDHCGAHAGMTVVSACGFNASACGADATLTIIGGCLANAKLCGADLDFAVGGCAANANVCAADGNVIPCAGYAVACVVDLGGGIDGGACIINVLPVLPSC